MKAEQRCAMDSDIAILELKNGELAANVYFLTPKEWLSDTIEKYGDLLDDKDYCFERMMLD